MVVEPERPRERGKPMVKVIKWVTGSVLAVAVAGAGYWAFTCPCDSVPGFVLRGEVHDSSVSDWSFANDVDLCQIQLSIAMRPHSVNINCMATPTGELYLSCSVGERKYWCPRVEADHRGRLRLNGVVYPVVLNRVTDPGTLDEVWSARVRKLQKPAVQAVQPPGLRVPPLDSERPDHWWTFHVRSAAAG